MITNTSKERVLKLYRERTYQELGCDSDGNEAFPMTQFTLFRTYNLLNYLTEELGDRWVEPTINRGWDGEIDLEWETETRWCSIAIFPDRPDYLLLGDEEDKEQDRLRDFSRGWTNSFEKILEHLEWFVTDG